VRVHPASPVHCGRFDDGTLNSPSPLAKLYAIAV
jgi:hypothetical protein